MTNVVVYDQDGHGGLSGDLISALAKNGGVQYHTWERVGCCPMEDCPQFVLSQSGQLIRLELMKGIVVFGTKSPASTGFRIPDGVPCLVESTNTAALCSLMSSSHTAICCGLSSKDTFSVSSLRDHEAVVSVQRHLTALDGRPIEPGDIPIRLSRAQSAYSIMASCAILLFSGRDPEHGFAF
nr:hypothetical protein [uncultured Solibaculum sp.]